MLRGLSFWGNVSGSILAPPFHKFAVAGTNLLTTVYNTGVPIPDQVQFVSDLGASFYRAGLRTSATGTLSTSDQNILFSTTADQQRNGLIPQLLAAGKPTVGMIYDRLFNDPSNPDYPNSGRSPLWLGTTQEAYNAGYQSCFQLVIDYGQYFTHFELSNEIDLFRNLFAFPGVPGRQGVQADDYIEIEGNPTPPIVGAYIAGMNDGVKDAKPTAVTMFNFTGNYPTYLTDQVLSFVATMGTYDLDLISIHTYNEVPNNVQQTLGISDIIEDLWGRWGKRMWITELGQRYNTGQSQLQNEQNQVNWWNGSWVTNALASPHIEKIFWFELLSRTNTGNPNGDNYGLYSFYDFDTNGFSNPQPKLLAQQFIAS